MLKIRPGRSFGFLTLALAAVLAMATPGTAPSASVYSSGLLQLGDGQPPAGFAGRAEISPRPGQIGPDWRDLFNDLGWARDDEPLDANGQPLGNGVPDYREALGGELVAFTADNEDAKPGFEPSARGTSERLIVNGAVAPSEDVANLLGYLTRDTAGDPVVFLAASRRAIGSTVLELELNQNFVHVSRGGYSRGAPWEVVGDRLAGDLLFRLQFEGEALSAVTLHIWKNDEAVASWVAIRDIPGEGCSADEALCALVNGNALDSGLWSGDSLVELAPGSFVELGADLASLVDDPAAFVTLQARTPNDIAFAYFSMEGR